MGDLSQLDFVPLANAALTALTAFLIWIAVRLGRRDRQSEPPPAAVEMKGAAIISGEPVAQLVRSIESYVAATATRRSDDERARAVGHSLVDAVKDLTEQIRELRTEMARRR